MRGVGEALPFADRTFDVAMAVLTVHHWSDPGLGLPEMARVAERQVVFFYESLLSEHERAQGAAHLRVDLDSGRWDERHGHLRRQDTFDGGYRLAVAGAARGPTPSRTI